MAQPGREPVKSAPFMDPPAVADDWVRVQSEMIARDRAQMESAERIRLDELKRHDARRRWWWSGAAVCFIVTVVIGALLTVGWFLWDDNRRDDGQNVILERERTKQIEFCTELEAPIERQFCIMSLNNPPQGEER